MTTTGNDFEKQQHEQFVSARESIVPTKIYVELPPNDEGLPKGAQVEVTRLTMRRFFALSRWLDSISNDPQVSEDFAHVMAMTTAEGDIPYMDMVFSINRILSKLGEEKFVELFTIITNASPELIVDHFDVQTSIEVVKKSVEKQGFMRVFQNMSANADNQTGSEEADKGNPTQPEASMDSSTASSPNMASPTPIYST